MHIGYARVSSLDQNLALQLDALQRDGCYRIFEDRLSGAVAQRPGLVEALSHLRRGDTLVVWRLDRLGRSLHHLIEVVGDLESKGVGLKSLQEDLDTSTSTGRLVFQMIGALAEFERNLIRERTQAGLQAARARGRVGGRPRCLTDEKLELLYRLVDEGKLRIRPICELLGISKPTLYRAMARRATNRGTEEIGT